MVSEFAVARCRIHHSYESTNRCFVRPCSCRLMKLLFLATIVSILRGITSIATMLQSCCGTSQMKRFFCHVSEIFLFCLQSSGNSARMSYPGSNLKGQECSLGVCACCAYTVLSIAYSGPCWNCGASVATDSQAVV